MTSAPQLITSSANGEFKRLKTLTQRSRQVKRTRQALIDGVHLIQACIEARHPILELVLAEGALRNPEVAELVSRMPGVSRMTISASLFSDLTDVVSPVGIAAVVSVSESATEHCCLSTDAAVLDGVQDAGNLGTILRTAAAVGISNVILGKGCARAWSNKVIRAGQGAHFRVTISEDVELIAWAALQKLPLVGAVLGASVDIFSARLHEPVIWVLGSEGRGVSPELVERLTMRVVIPMAPGVESLNVGAAAAVCFYEAYRQRQVRL